MNILSRGDFMFKTFNLNKGLIFILCCSLLCFVCTLFTVDKVIEANNESRRLPIYSVETSERKISITFDAAWSAEDTDLLMKILKKHNTKATFFVVGDWVKQNPDALKKLFENGHEIGNHSDKHPAYSRLSRGEIRQDMLDCNAKIKAITNSEIKLCRAPSGDYDNKSIEVCESLGMKMIQWDVDSLDWKLLSVDEMYARVTSKVQNGSIILFHNGVENTPEALDKILTKLEKDGYEFVTVSELIYWDNYTIDHTGRQIYYSNN